MVRYNLRAVNSVKSLVTQSVTHTNLACRSWLELRKSPVPNDPNKCSVQDQHRHWDCNCTLCDLQGSTDTDKLLLLRCKSLEDTLCIRRHHLHQSNVLEDKVYKHLPRRSFLFYMCTVFRLYLLALNSTLIHLLQTFRTLLWTNFKLDTTIFSSAAACK